ncbi:LPXTG cell wall anchor domain-containing protein [Enterococcus ratti]|uniref:LPXTG cell wall anchor domain-containing protein n=1 Tax=Enterococcus ratti TaxID=150033 RepID=UPI0008FFFC85|nr:LPXTG cell wall anchor domain-containing protein [Enterococcus ratti]
MARFGKDIFFLVVVLGCMQLLMSVEPTVFAASERSSVGITFKGSIPQQKTNNSDKQTKNEEENHHVIARKTLPKTNEKKSLITERIGFILVGVCLLFMLLKRRKKEEKK